MEPCIHRTGVFERVSKVRTCKTIPFLSDFLNAVKAPSERLSNLLRPMNEFVAGKRISAFRETDGVSKEALLVRE